MFFDWTWASLWTLGTFEFGAFPFFHFSSEFVQLSVCFLFFLVYSGFHLVLGGSGVLSLGDDFLFILRNIDMMLDIGTLYCTWFGDGAT